MLRRYKRELVRRHYNKNKKQVDIVTNRRLDGLRLVLRATGGIVICQVIRLQVRKEECDVY